MTLDHINIYYNYTRRIYGVFLGCFEGREARAEEAIPEGEFQFRPSESQVLALVDRALGNWAK